MYRMAQQTLTASGYDHYEICNYAKPGYQAQHNLTYWRSQPYYGFGMGATSYLHSQRIDRPRTQQTYHAWVDQFVAQKGKTNDPVISVQEQVLESLMVGLRLKEGITLNELYQVYGEPGLRAIEKAILPWCGDANPQSSHPPRLPDRPALVHVQTDGQELSNGDKPSA